jgi:ATP-dependent Clp protease ATP-binding subunit ClpA
MRDLLSKLEKRHISLVLDDKARIKIADEGFDPDFGARPLRRLIQRDIQDPLALRLLKGEFKDGDRVKVTVDPKDGSFTFEKESARVAAKSR